jgi:hypothetical protein
MTQPKTKAITDGLPTITPHIVVPGSAAQAGLCSRGAP